MKNEEVIFAQIPEREHYLPFYCFREFSNGITLKMFATALNVTEEQLLAVEEMPNTDLVLAKRYNQLCKVLHNNTVFDYFKNSGGEMVPIILASPPKKETLQE